MFIVKKPWYFSLSLLYKQVSHLWHLALNILGEYFFSWSLFTVEKYWNISIPLPQPPYLVNPFCCQRGLILSLMLPQTPWPPALQTYSLLVTVMSPASLSSQCFSVCLLFDASPLSGGSTKSRILPVLIITVAPISRKKPYLLNEWMNFSFIIWKIKITSTS